jgi:hypothetical protein
MLTRLRQPFDEPTALGRDIESSLSSHTQRRQSSNGHHKQCVIECGHSVNSFQRRRHSHHSRAVATASTQIIGCPDAIGPGGYPQWCITRPGSLDRRPTRSVRWYDIVLIRESWGR